MLADGQVATGELPAAAREADLLAHPYTGVEHVQLARLRAANNEDEYAKLRGQLRPGVPRRWWRPRGPRSALRRSGLAAREAARRRAEG
jgi:hypothetical protein